MRRVIAMTGIIVILVFMVLMLASAIIATASHVPEHVTGKVTTCSEGISWDANTTDDDIAGYNMFWGTESGVYGTGLSVAHSAGARIVVPCSEAELVDKTQYYFTVNSEDNDKNVSAQAPELAFFLEFPDTTPPAVPGGLDVN